VLACAPTELHTIGLEAIAVMLGRRGWACNVLGAMTPPGSLLTALRTTRSAGAIVTAQRSVGRRGAIEALRVAGQMPGVRLFYGGNAFATTKARDGVPGIYLGTDLRAAVDIVEAEIR
jgi:methanogenic corrinoid protein MtbC1